MNSFSEGKQDLGAWSAKFGEETRKHRHPCKYNEDQYMMCSPGRSCQINLLLTRRVYW